MAKFDLTSRIGQYLDRHLVFPLLEFLSAKEVTLFRLCAATSHHISICFRRTMKMNYLKPS